MNNDITDSARIFTNIQGLEKLKYSDDKSGAKKEVAQQFEAMFMQMVFKSMRDAANAFDSGLFGSNQMAFYQDMFDKQLSLMLSNTNLGLAKMIENNIDHIAAKYPTPNNQVAQNLPTPGAVQVEANQTQVAHEPGQITDRVEKSVQPIFKTQKDFVHKLWSTAKSAAKFIGVAPEILLAQAALETNWGKKIVAQQPEQSSHNLFNIKAGDNWHQQTVGATTIEQSNGVLTREHAQFRKYESYQESFMDYISLLKNNARYDQALLNAQDPEQFITAVHNAGYATDPKYAEKVLDIYSSSTFKTMIDEVKHLSSHDNGR